MSSFNDYLEGKLEGGFDRYVSDQEAVEFSLADTAALNEEQKSMLGKIMGSAKLAYDKAALNAKIAYARAIDEAKAIYAKTAGGAKNIVGSAVGGIKAGGKKVADGTIKAKDFAVKEIDDTIEEIKENKELAIKVSVASAVATASAIGLACLIFKKRK